jgi:nucleoside-triphosphatase THEP1
MIALVTGETGCGKTTVCQRAIDLLRARGVAVSGILSPARRDASGANVGTDVVDVATGERRRLADVVPSGGETIGNFTFDQQSLDWARDRLLAAVVGLGRVGEAGVLVVDEIGPLELERGVGFVEVLGPLADASRVPRGLVVVRRECLEALERQTNRPDGCRFWVDEARREYVPAEIASVFE